MFPFKYMKYVAEVAGWTIQSSDMFEPLRHCGFVLSALAIIVHTSIGVLEESQAQKRTDPATFILNDRMFTCNGEMVGVKACGGSPNDGGTHFYLSLYASSNNAGSMSILLPAVVHTNWGLAGDVEWKHITQRWSSNSFDGVVRYSKGHFLGVTIYHQSGVDTRPSLPVHVMAGTTEASCDKNSALRMIVRITKDCYHNIMSGNDSQKMVTAATVTPTNSPETTHMLPTGEPSSTAGLIAGIVILLVGIVVESILCGTVWLVCLQRVWKGSSKNANGPISANNIARRRVHSPGNGGEPVESETSAPSARFSVLLQRDEQRESQEDQQQQIVGYETMATAQSAMYINASTTHEAQDESDDYWSPGESAKEVYSQMTVKRFVVIPGRSIKLGQVLGEGEYGVVFKGVWSSPNGIHPSAVKVLHENATEEDRVKLLQEGAIMGQFCHPNVIKLHGVVKDPDPVMLVMEYLSGGDLRNHLLTTKELMDTSAAAGVTSQQLVAFCIQIASGMAYLSAKGFVHRDLAARNVLLNKEYRCKIADFGMSRNVDKDTYYKTKGGRIPVKWTAPEAILFRKYTTKSDVWSYGMVMYEIWSLGHKPFEGFSVEEIIKSFSESYCQPPPPGCPRDIYMLMVHCWNPTHTQRPSFTFLMRELKKCADTLLTAETGHDHMPEAGHAHLLGAPLQAAKYLYLDLQQMYTA